MDDSTLTLDLLARYAGGRRVFVETGTARGEGVQVAIDHGFSRIYSIEANPDVYLAAAQRFADEGHVQCCYGDGRVVLPVVLEQFREPAVFWLDSHWSSGEPSLARGFSACPVIGELLAIARHRVKSHVILVDDVRYFWKGLPQWGGVTVADIIPAILDIDPRYSIRFEYGVTESDILVAVPPGPDGKPVPEAVEEYEKWQT